MKILSICLKNIVVKLVKGKGVYPYEYMDSFKKSPDKCEFFSSLKDKCISKEEYDRGVNI